MPAANQAQEVMVRHRPEVGGRFGAPALSVLIPYFDDDPTRLVQWLLDAAEHGPADIEIVLLNDGSPTRSAAPLLAMARRAVRPVGLLELAVNQGRAAARNLLGRYARGRFLLFLDADVLPAAHDFLARYLAHTQMTGSEVAVGGLRLTQPAAADNDPFPRFCSAHSNCVSAAARHKQPERYVIASNLLVRRDILAACPFDEAFRGWGWEDVEWGIRVSRRHRIAHIDNPVIHLGVPTTGELIAKYVESVGNFSRLVNLHLEEVRHVPIYRASRVMARLPGRRMLERALRATVLNASWPVLARYLCLKLYVACLYAPVVSRASDAA
jgi:glycosyltransferase involved in cell wall biosynthesis